MAQGTLNAVQTLRATIGFDVYTKPEVDALLDEKADKTDTYTKAETNSLLDDKADKSTTYTKTEVDNALSLKANSADVYTKTEADNLLYNKADKATTLAGYGITDAYTKTETDNLLNGKADADDVYTKSEIDTKIPSSVGSATKPIYVNGGILTECTHELNKTVPANAVFTDTIYTAGNGLNLSGTSFSAKAGTNVTVDGNGINVNGNGAVASADSRLISGGTAYTELRPTLDGTWVKNAQTTATNLQKLEGGIEYLYAILSKQYDQLKKYINGNYYDYDTDNNSKYVKNIPQGAMPYASLEQIGGKTVVWNQYISLPTAGTVNLNNGVTVTNNGDGSLTLNGTATERKNAYALGSFPLANGHKYVCVCQNAPADTYVYVQYYNGGSWAGNRSAAFALNSLAYLDTTLTANTIRCYLDVRNGATYSNTQIYINITDLTLLYGSGNEPTTVAEFQQMFPASYYSYNAGTLLSAGVTEVVSKGKNLVNVNDTSYAVGYYLLDGSYNASSGWRNFSVDCVAGDKFTKSGIGWGGIVTFWNGASFVNGVNGLSVTVPSGANRVVFAFELASADNLQVEKGATATAYSPYQEHTYPIPASIQALEGYGWSAGSVYNYVDYERKVFVKNVGRVDLGSFNYGKVTTFTIPHFVSTTALSDAKGSVLFASIPNVVTPMYLAGNFENVYGNNASDKRITLIYEQSPNAKKIMISDTNASYTDGTVFKTAMSGVYMYYELATPTETDISAYLTDDNLISVESGGTLTFPNQNGDDYRIDVPSSETYMVDLQASL